METSLPTRNILCMYCVEDSEKELFKKKMLSLGQKKTIAERILVKNEDDVDSMTEECKKK
jgi:hypothetical protein